ncbi:MAG: hypothetical protein AAF738_09185 [Bacteroidota bacterium]
MTKELVNEVISLLKWLKWRLCEYRNADFRVRYLTKSGELKIGQNCNDVITFEICFVGSGCANLFKNDCLYARLDADSAPFASGTHANILQKAIFDVEIQGKGRLEIREHYLTDCKL